jgi:p21-activated kinase 1
MVLDAETFQNPRKAPKPPVGITSNLALPIQAPSSPSPLELGRPASFLYNAPSLSLSNPDTRSLEVQAWKNKVFDIENFKAIAGLRELSLKDTQNPTVLYRSPEKIGQGAWGTVEAALTVGTNARVAVKRVNLVDHPKKRLIINEIQVLKKHSHKNIVGYIDSYLWKGEIWIVMEYMAGGNLAEVVAACQMSERHIAAVCREVFMNRVY